MADPTLDNLRSALEELTGVVRSATDGMGRMGEAERNTEEMRKKSAEMFTNAITGATKSLTSFSSTVLNTERSFAKYGATVDNLSNTVSGLLGNFGKFGQLLGGAVTGVGALTKVYLDQADKLNKATDDLKKLGTAGSFTAKEFLDLAHNARLSANSLGSLVKPIQSLGPSLLVIGNNTGIAAANFAKIAKYTEEELARADRLGISQEDLIQSTADYIDLQVKSGRATAAELKDRDKLRQLSFEYAENLQVISKVTGIEAAEAKKRTQALAAEAGWQLYQRRLIREGRGGEAQASQGFVTTLAQQKFDPQTIAAIAKFIETGAVPPGGGQLGTIPGLLPALQAARRDLQGGTSQEQGMAIAGRLAQALGRGIDANAANPGLALAATLNQRVGSATGLTGQNLTQAGIISGQNIEQELADARRDILKAEKKGYDDAADARANLATIEREAATTMSKLLGATNPLIDGFKASTFAAYALAGAAGAAAASLGGLAGSGGISGKPKGGWSDTGGAGAKGKGGIGRLGVGAALGGAVLGLAGSVASDAGYTKTGAALDVGGYALGGASLGSLLGPAGTVVGGVLGAGYGLYKNWDKFGSQEAVPTGTPTNFSEKGLLDFIAKYESAGKYDAVVGSRTGIPGLTQMTVGQVLEYQRQSGRQLAIGRYQIQRDTLTDLVKDGKASLNDKFDEATQDRLAVALLERRGLSDYKSGKLSAPAFADRLAKEWAALPLASGASAHTGVGNNKAGVSRNEFMQAIGAAKAEKGGIFSGSRTGYPVELHGNELVAPLNPSSLLTKLLITPESDMVRELNLNNINSSRSSDDTVLVNAMMSVSDKLEEVLYTLRASQSIQDKLLQYSRA